MGQDVWTLLGMLATAAAILVLAHYVTKWVAGRSGLRTMAGASGGFQVLGQISVGRNERLTLVRLESRCLLLGVTAGGISLLAELTEEEAARWLQKRTEQTTPTFAEALRETLTRKK